MSEKSDYRWQRSILDEMIREFPDQWISIGPKHPAWKERVKLEINRIVEYINFLKQTQNKSWFKLYPEKSPKINYLIWNGYLLVPERPEINFDIRVLLTSEYPKVSPRCFIDSEIVNYCGKVFLKNIWNPQKLGLNDNKKYIMICHEHLANTKAWQPSLGIVHFFIRQIWIWWAAQQNAIITEFDKKHHH